MRASRVVGIVASRTLLIAVIVVASIGVLASLIYGALAHSATVYVSQVEVGVVSEHKLQLDMPTGSHFDYSTMVFSIPAEQNPALPLLEWATVLPFITAGLTCLMLLVLAIQLLRRRSFGVITGAAMMLNAVVAIVSGVAAPALQAKAEQIMVAHLHLPQHGPAPDWVTPGVFDWTDSNWPLVLLGLTIGLGGWLVLRGRTLQRDLEGTI